MNTKEALKLLNITDEQFELSVNKLQRIEFANEFVTTTEKYLKTYGHTLEAMGGKDELEGNIEHCKQEMLNIALDDFTTIYRSHNSDIANMAMYKLAMAFKDEGYHVWNSTYGNDICASIYVEIDECDSKIQIFIPNSTEDDIDNEGFADYYVSPKDMNDETIDGDCEFFQTDQISEIVSYVKALHAMYKATCKVRNKAWNK